MVTNLKLLCCCHAVKRFPIFKDLGTGRFEFLHSCLLRYRPQCFWCITASFHYVFGYLYLFQWKEAFISKENSSASICFADCSVNCINANVIENTYYTYLCDCIYQIIVCIEHLKHPLKNPMQKKYSSIFHVYRSLVSASGTSPNDAYTITFHVHSRVSCMTLCTCQQD